LNVVPTDAWLGGTVRTFSEDMLDLIERRMHTFAASVASAFDCECEVDFERQ
jgi:hippurate hydrolase